MTSLWAQVKYKEEGKKEMCVNLFSLLPETNDTLHAKQVSHLQSEVGYTHTRAHVRTHAHTHPHTHGYPHSWTHTGKPSDLLTHTDMDILKDAHTHTHMDTTH